MDVERLMTLLRSVRTTPSPREIGSEERFTLCEGQISSRSERGQVSDGVLSLVALNLIMDLLWMILLLFVVCAEAKKLTVVQVELGQNVTLNCSLTATAIYWYMEIHSQFRGCIARTYSESSDNNYYVSTSVTKFVAISKTSLMITNVTADDCRLYFCGKKINDNLNLEETFHIVADVPVTPSTNVSETNHPQQQHIWRTWLTEPVIFVFFALNVLLLVVTGLVFVSLCLKKKKFNYQVTDPSASTCESPETQETPQDQEVQPDASKASQSAALPPEFTFMYYKVKCPGSMLPRQRHLGRLDDC